MKFRWGGTKRKFLAYSPARPTSKTAGLTTLADQSQNDVQIYLAEAARHEDDLQVFLTKRRGITPIS